MKLNLKKYIIGLGLGISVLCTGCIQDDRTECRFPLDLSFSYTSHREGNDRLRDDVKSLRLFLYDAESGKLCDTRSVDVASLDSLNTMQWMVAPGNYRLVAWGGDHAGRYVLNTHSNHDDALMNVATNADGDIEHQAEQLWHGVTTDITIDGDYHKSSVCKLNRMTSNVSVKTTGLDYDHYDRVVTRISGSNGTYTFTGTAHPDNKISTWIPWHEVITEDSKAVGLYKFTTMKVRKGDDTRLTVVYVPERLATKSRTTVDDDTEQVLYNGALTDLIELHPTLDIDLDFEFDLKVEITEQIGNKVAFNIYINDWLVIRSNADLG